MADAARAILAKNGDLTVEQFSAALAKILGNVLSHPGEDKYHRIKAKAKLVQRTIGRGSRRAGRNWVGGARLRDDRLGWRTDATQQGRLKRSELVLP